MGENERKEFLREIICSVLEQTAFLFPETVDLNDGVSFDEHEMVWASINYSGDREGEVTLIIPMALCQELSTNLLGEDAENNDEKDKAIDAAKEILNIITGQLLTRMYGERALFNLSAPQIKDFVQEEFFGTLEQKDYICNMVDDYPVIATLTTRSEEYEYKSINR
jgi:chemotaxis protein CheY-P-specific phosphatase CheC